MLCSELIIVFGSGTQKWCHFLIFGHPIVPCDSATPGLDKTGLGMFGIKNLTWFEWLGTYVYRSYILVAKSCTNYLVGFTKCNFFFGKKVSNLIFCSKTVKTTFYLCQKNRRPWICWLLRNKWTKYIKTLLKLYLIVHNFIFWP